MIGAAFPAMRPWLNMSSSHTNRNDEAVTTYAELMKYLLRRYATAAVTAKTDKDI